MAENIELLLQRLSKLKDARRVWEDHWDRLAELMLPKRADFISERQRGERRMEEQYDGTPMQAARNLASAVDGFLKPKTTRWFHIRAVDPFINDMDETKQWLAEVENRMYSAIYNRRSRFIQATGEVDLDLVVFGTGVISVDMTEDQSSLLFQHHHLKNVYVARNSDGEVDTVFLCVNYTARQAAQKFPNPGRKARACLQGNAPKGPDETIKYVQCIKPRRMYNPRSPLNTDMPYASIWVEVDEKEKVFESGFDEFPFMVPTWDSAEGEIYGRSPGMLALPDANTVNMQAKTLLKAGQKAVDPPLLIANDSVIGSVRMFPGSNTYFDARAAKMMGRIPIEPLNTGANMPLGREMLHDTREMIWNAFLRNILQLPQDRPEMTATEVLERKEEFMRVAGPVFGRLESDYIGPMIDRVYNLMARAEAFPPAPEYLEGADIKFEYESPIEKARKQVEAAAAARALEVLTPYIQGKPDILDNFDLDQMSRDVGEAHGMKQTWLKPVESVKQEREARAQMMAQQEQQQQMLEMSKGGADLIKALPPGTIEGLAETIPQ
jgi:hypothetical protein